MNARVFELLNALIGTFQRFLLDEDALDQNISGVGVASYFVAYQLLRFTVVFLGRRRGDTIEKTQDEITLFGFHW
ncbi:protein of unknown function [Candidatus Filomicrobium marinum]|uniref:Uncharacterized protein n=1 Tax=Candidatus Filomicrobium marinum TaxID=1608628 RepID=A0A0D6JDG2_9HYPH|nr:protein of unknown function [Candidatus Filomicrobium marinum]CPR17859.1 protein of unknown function [Candidatus Filomicrobium marinum]